ncbi:hypothetical protein LUZ60_017054 [Juncus effusus]|nr:hypothetical protein LUZ60_017054 [Juncus effusus]
MGLKKNLINAIAFLLLACAVSAQNLISSVYNVMDYGATADGQTDNTLVFQQTWEKVCMTEGNPRFLIPEGSYLLGPLIFKGPCKGHISIQLKGKLLAPTDVTKYTANWIEFQYIKGLTISGGGTFDGQGASAWSQDMCPKNSQCRNLPMSVVFAFIENLRMSGVHVKNSKSFHVNVFNSDNVHFHALKISAPADSPNTDGIHMGDISNVNITDTTIGTGDDCISIGPGSINVTVTNVKCGPGHGISIGSLGRYVNERDVKNLKIQNCTLTNTQNGVRVKTWQDNPSPLAAAYIVFEDITMNNVLNPIIIDQKYCPHYMCTKNSPSKVKIEHVTFKNIKGTSASPEGIQLVCSDAVPCEGIELSNINLESNNGAAMSATCVNVQGTSDGSVSSSACTMINSL